MSGRWDAFLAACQADFDEQRGDGARAKKLETMAQKAVDSVIERSRVAQSVANTLAGKTVVPSPAFTLHDEVTVDVSQGDSAEQVIRKLLAEHPKGGELVIDPLTPKSWSEIDGK